MLIPMLVLDKSVRNVLIEVVLLTAYLSFVIPRKGLDIRVDELIYVFAFSILGTLLGFFMRRVRLDNLELLRQSEIRETTDVLTGLYNRRKLFDYFERCEAGKEGNPITGISILDIDYFKTYNDTYGHLAGDSCLKAIGECLQTYGKQHDMEFFRYGGEEIVAISHEQDRERLTRSFQNIVTAVEIIQIPRKSGVVTISQGVLFYCCQEFLQ